MNSDQVSGLFGASEAFVEGTIAAALVILWILTVALHLARGYMARTTGKFTLRLGADLWWIIYFGLRDIMLLQVFLGSFIFFYPDVVKGRDLPIKFSQNRLWLSWIPNDVPVPRMVEPKLGSIPCS